VLSHFIYAIALVFATVLVHAACTTATLEGLRSDRARQWALHSPLSRVSLLAALVFFLSLAAFTEAAIWAGFYVLMDVLPSFEEALYFSLVTLTTLGFGDITLPVGWRLLSAFQAANGVILFGWTTALIVAVVQRVYVRRSASEGDD